LLACSVPTIALHVGAEGASFQPISDFGRAIKTEIHIRTKNKHFNNAKRAVGFAEKP
jgi:hypothetical protein